MIIEISINNMMESISKLKCLKNGNALRVCNTPNCQQSPLMCGSLECECQKMHSYCMMTPSISSIHSMMLKKGKSLESVISLFIKWHEEQIKQFTIRLE